MSFDETVTKALAEPLDPARVKTREGSGGRRLSYLEGHDVIRTANRIFGFGGWSSEVLTLDHILSEPVTRDNRQGYRVGYRATVRVHAGDAVFADTGYGDATEYTGSAITPHELASKEAVTDALKRCLMHFGDQFGLVLYSKDAPAPAAPQAVQQAQAAQPSSGDEWRWPFGKHKGSTLTETPGVYLEWFLNNGTDGAVKQRIRSYLNLEELAGLDGAFVGDDDIQFAPTMDGTV